MTAQTTLGHAIKRVVNIWDCPLCETPAGEYCRQQSRAICDARLPYNFDPKEMLRTAETERLIRLQLRIHPCPCKGCNPRPLRAVA